LDARLSDGVQFDRILDRSAGPFASVAGFAKPPAEHVGPAAAGYALVIPSTTLLRRSIDCCSREDVYTLLSPLRASRTDLRRRHFYIVAKPTTFQFLRARGGKGLTFDPFQTDVPRPRSSEFGRRGSRYWDQYGGAITSGWARFVLEQFEFPYQVVLPAALDAGNLISKFDILICPTAQSFARPNSRTVRASIPTMYPLSIAIESAT